MTEERALNRGGCSAVQWAAAAGNVCTLRWLQARGALVIDLPPAPSLLLPTTFVPLTPHPSTQAKGLELGHVNEARHGAVVKAAYKGHDEAACHTRAHLSRTVARM